MLSRLISHVVSRFRHPVKTLQIDFSDNFLEERVLPLNSFSIAGQISSVNTFLLQLYSKRPR